MSDVSVRQDQDEGPADAPSGDGNGEDAVPEYGPWVSFFGYVHRVVPYRTAVVGTATVVGAFAIEAYIVALLTRDLDVSLLATVGAIVGGVLFAGGFAYFMIRHNVSCEECRADFSKEPIGRSIEHRESDGRAQPVQVLECQNCGHRTRTTFSSQEQDPPTW